MKRTITLFLMIGALFTSCVSENYSNGERIGLVTQFSETGIIWKSWEGHLNLTQTGMNSSVPFDFSIDNDNENPALIATIDSAANLGWKVKLVYHETFGKNWFDNRGETDHFVKECHIIDRTPMQTAFGTHPTEQQHGRVVDTIYVVIDKSK